MLLLHVAPVKSIPRKLAWSDMICHVVTFFHCGGLGRAIFAERRIESRDSARLSGNVVEGRRLKFTLGMMGGLLGTSGTEEQDEKINPRLGDDHRHRRRERLGGDSRPHPRCSRPGQEHQQNIRSSVRPYGGVLDPSTHSDPRICRTYRRETYADDRVGALILTWHATGHRSPGLERREREREREKDGVAELRTA